MHHGVMPSHARPGVFLHHLSCAAAAAEARMRGAEQYLYFYSNIRADNSFLVVHHREVIRSVISTSVIQHITHYTHVSIILCIHISIILRLK